ncbi:MAG TPA: (Fe-S)-binding protein [Verrucomicrobiae bacterium]|jgi:glycolate oxidase iron-sulfur subunit|nr:(Fe-S)-binding protein [Verrucomicrobiae bacterium]
MTDHSYRLRRLDYSVLQQCMHCGLCLSTCPTYDATKMERHSPRGRIALMRAVADGELAVTSKFADEMYFCLGCLACATACPAGVNYAELFETARADVEESGVLSGRKRDWIRWFTLRFLFTRPRALRLAGRLLFFYQMLGLQRFVRTCRLTRLLPRRLREIEPLTPTVRRRFSDGLIKEVETPSTRRYRVGVLTGCVQDLIYPEINRDTVDVLLRNGCEVITPRRQHCCGSLHSHNGEHELACDMARRNIEAMEKASGSLDHLDAIISNAGGCGSHLKNYGHLLRHDPIFAVRADAWSRKLKDVHEWLAEIGIEKPARPDATTRVTYHDSCHLCHGQKITRAPRETLRAIPGIELVELPEASWCCGSAGIYNITQPEMSRKLLLRKLAHIESTHAAVVASANPGCTVQIEAGLREAGGAVKVLHPISILADAYRQSP